MNVVRFRPEIPDEDSRGFYEDSENDAPPLKKRRIDEQSRKQYSDGLRTNMAIPSLRRKTDQDQTSEDRKLVDESDLGKVVGEIQEKRKTLMDPLLEYLRTDQDVKKYPIEVVTNKVMTKRSVIYRKRQQTEEEKTLLAKPCTLLEDDDQLERIFNFLGEIVIRHGPQRQGYLGLANCMSVNVPNFVEKVLLPEALLKAMEVVWHMTHQESERKLTATPEVSEEEAKLAEIEISRQKLTREEICQANRRILRQAQHAGLNVNFRREDLYADLDDQED